MAKNRFNPRPDFSPKSERQPKEEPSVPATSCIICQKMTQSYGRWENGSTCSKTCEAVKRSEPRFLGEECD